MFWAFASVPSLLPSHFAGEACMKCDLCFWRAALAPSLPRSHWLLSLEHSASHSGQSWCHGPGKQMNLGGTMTLFSCRCPHQRGRDGKDLLDHPAHCSQSSVRSVPALYFVFCPVQTVSLYWISVLPKCLIMQGTGAELSSVAFSLGPTISEELKGWTFYRCPLNLLGSAGS